MRITTAGLLLAAAWLSPAAAGAAHVSTTTARPPVRATKDEIQRMKARVRSAKARVVLDQKVLDADNAAAAKACSGGATQACQEAQAKLPKDRERLDNEKVFLDKLEAELKSMK